MCEFLREEEPIEQKFYLDPGELELFGTTRTEFTEYEKWFKAGLKEAEVAIRVDEMKTSGYQPETSKKYQDEVVVLGEWVVKKILRQQVKKSRVAHTYPPPPLELLQSEIKRLYRLYKEKQSNKGFPCNLIGSLTPQTEGCSYKAEYITVVSSVTNAICAFCKQVELGANQRCYSRNCTRCAYCPTCTSYILARLKQPEEPGNWDLDPSFNQRICYSFDCISRIRGTSVNGEKPQCARRKPTKRIKNK